MSLLDNVLGGHKIKSVKLAMQCVPGIRGLKQQKQQYSVLRVSLVCIVKPWLKAVEAGEDACLDFSVHSLVLQGEPAITNRM